MASARLCVRLLSGGTVYEGPRPRSLAELRDEVAASIGCKSKDEVVFCSGDVVLDCIEDAGEAITAVHDPVFGLLKRFLWYDKQELPKCLWPAREHRRLILSAVAINGRLLQHASAELRADRDVVLAAVACRGAALQYASPELQADRDVVLAAMANDGWALRYASAELRADREVVLAAVACRGAALQYASPELRADREVVLAGVACRGSALQYASPELRADRDVVLAAVANGGCALHAAVELRSDPDVVLAGVACSSAWFRARANPNPGAPDMHNPFFDFMAGLGESGC